MLGSLPSFLQLPSKSLLLSKISVNTISGIVYENYIFEDDMVYIDILPKLCEEWKQFERRATIIVDQKLSEIRDKKISLSNHVQEAKDDGCNNTISYLYFELDILERKLQMILDHQMMVVRVNNNLLYRAVHQYKNESTLQSKQLRNDVMDQLDPSKPKKMRIREVDEKAEVVMDQFDPCKPMFVRTYKVDGKGEVVLGVDLFDADTMIVT
jgi:hypothetical protein